MGSGTSGKPDYHNKKTYWIGGDRATKEEYEAFMGRISATNAFETVLRGEEVYIPSYAPQLDSELVEKANDAGLFENPGNETSREYARNVEEINGADMTDSEKRVAYERLHKLTEDQLRAEAESRTPNSKKNAGKAAKKTRDFMNEVREFVKSKRR